MTHEITADEHYIQAESVTWEYTIEEDGSAKDISGATISWYLLDRQGDAAANAVLDDSESGVTAAVATDGTDGRVDVTIDQDATADLAGTYWQRLVVDDSGTGKQIWHGPFPIKRA